MGPNIGGGMGGGEGIGSVNVKIRGDFSQLRGDMKEAQDVVKESISGFDLGQLGEQFTQMGAALTAGLTLPIVAAGAAIVAVAGKMEQAEIAFAGLLGSAEKAGAFLTELKDFAAKTPFEFPDLVQASKRMLALGFEAQKIIPTLRTVGDAAAGLGAGAQGIDRITLALGQMAAKGKVSAQEMNQLAEVGIKGWDILAKSVGKSVAEMQKLAEKGALDGAAAVDVILAGLNKQFAGQMEKQSQTLLGQWSNFKDQVTFILMDFGKILLPVLKDALAATMPLLDILRELAHWFSELPAPVRNAAVALVALVAAAGPMLLIAGQLATGIAALQGAFAVVGITSFSGAMAALVPILGYVAAAVAVVAAAWALWQLPEVQDAVSRLSASLQEFWNQTLLPLIETLKETAVQFFNITTAIVQSGLQAAWETLMDIGAVLVQNFREIQEQLKPLGEAFSELRDASRPLTDALGELLDIWLSIVGAVIKAELGLIFAGITKYVQYFTFAVKEMIDIGFIPLRFVLALLTPLFQLLTAEMRLFAPVVQKVADTVADMVAILYKLPGVKAVIDTFTSSWKNLSKSASQFADEADRTNKAVATLRPEVEKAVRANVSLGDAARSAAGLINDLGNAHQAAVPKVRDHGFWMKVLEENTRRFTAEQSIGVKLMADYIANFMSGKVTVALFSDGMDALNKVLVETSTVLPKVPEALRTMLVPALEASIPAAVGLREAIRELGIKAPKDFELIAQKAKEMEAAVLGDSRSSDFEKRTAVYIALKAQVEAAEAARVQVPEKQRDMLAQMERELNIGGKKITSATDQIMSDIGRSVEKFVLDAGAALFSGDMSFGEKFKRMWHDLRDIALNAFLKPVADSISKFVQNELKSLIDGLNDAGLKAGSLFKKIPGQGGGVPSAGGAGSGSGGVPGAGGGTGGGFGFNPGTIDMVSGIGTLVSSIIGNFQMAHQETTLNAIEHETRFSQIHLSYILGRVNEYLPKLGEISEYLWSKQSAWFQVLSGQLETISFNTLRIGDLMAFGGNMEMALPTPGTPGKGIYIDIHDNIFRTQDDVDSLMDSINQAIGAGART